ncbi:type II CRISPR RNA-guided endonuclease Cas9 [Rubritalea squalenifaciens]|nr:type II CRISPR RNA-guided endonuclease Cas9 [Rubritalea squalenifaciens]
MNPSKYTLGLDMGVASIGWAVVSQEDKFIDCGVRVFPAGLDNFNSAKEKHPNMDRRSARGMRRRIRRKAERKKLIKGILQQLGWMPKDPVALDQWMAMDVYELRSRAIHEQISLDELGRIILHLNQRRGFLSLRKAEEDSSDKETQGMLGEIKEFQKEIDSSGAQTVGNYLYQIYQKEGIHTSLRNRNNNRRLNRSMLYHEFDLIWNTQQAYYPDTLTEQLRYGSLGKKEKPTKVVKPVPLEDGRNLLDQFGIENLTFFQRKVYWPAGSIGQCELEPEEKRAPVADRRFQEFRMLQEVNNLRVLDDSNPRHPEERKLTPEERNATIAYLTGKKEVTFDALKKHLCKHRALQASLPDSPAQLKFNLEAGGRTKISATPTDHTLSARKTLAKDWNALPEDTKNRIVEILTAPAATDDDIAENLSTLSELTDDQRDKLLRTVLPSGYCNLSVVALEKLLPHMRQGKVYMAKDQSDSALHAAGYKRRDEEQTSTFDLLPNFAQLTDPKSSFYDPHQVIINNPVVLRSLTELRKIVNGLIRKYGKPHKIHLEMARSLKMSPKQRSEHQKRNRQHEKERDAARKDIEKLGIIPNNDAIILYRLWKEQDKLCVYSGKPISISQLFNGEVDIDHIYPFSQSADNSLSNKVVCLSQENRDKGQRLPYTWLAHSDPEKYEAALQRAKKLPGGKYKRFIAQQIPEGFVNRDLNDTAWMAKAARQYLSHLFERPHHILCTKGNHTSTLRNQWELHSLLRHDELDLKNRDDHRHHALDAIVIALCTQDRIQEITRKLKHELKVKEAREEGKRVFHFRAEGERLEIPWHNFRLDVAERLNSIWVSHRPSRKVSGALHKETNYGKTAEGKLVLRKPVQSLSKKEVEGICDDTIRDIVRSYIHEAGGDLAALKAISADAPLTMPSGIPIRKVRTAIPYAHITIRPGSPHETHVQSASTHHLAIFSLGEGKFHFEPVTLYEATRRQRHREPLVQKSYADMPPEAEFLFHLCSGDSILAEIDGTDQLFVFNTMATSTGQVWFAHHTDAAQGHKDPDTGQSLLRSCMPGSFAKKFPNARKVTVLPTGEIRDA